MSKNISKRLLKLLKELEVTRNQFLAAHDKDSLHDFRVSLRTLRAALKTLSAVQGKSKIKPLQDRLKQLARQTNLLRDEEALEEVLPKIFRTGSTARAIKTWFKQRKPKRTRLDRRIRNILASEIVMLIIEQIRDELIKPLKKAPKKKIRHALNTTFNKQQKQFKKIISDKEVKQANPELIHRIRIQAKRLRYNIELFGSLLPKDLAALEKLAKRVQKNLGDMHDLDVAKTTIAHSKAHTRAVRDQLITTLNEKRTALIEPSRETLKRLKKQLSA